MATEPSDGMFIFKQNRKMRLGHTTGTCAAAATKAALTMLFSQLPVTDISIMTPRGTELTLRTEDTSFRRKGASCAVRKDGGDDIDCTHGTLIYSDVSLSDEGVNIDGGKGVGRVTRNGLDQPIGSAAINRVPREMILNSVKDVCDKFGYRGGVNVVISAPEGEELAKGTFNPRLGIVGGISIIGTSGIVEPMSERAIVDTMRVEMKVRIASGSRYLLIVPGNYGESFASSHPELKDENSIKCSNFVGEALDSALEFSADGVLLVGNIGKMVKLAGGIMNTHSKYADCRMEILAACSVMAGVDGKTAAKLMDCVTTDDALDVISGTGSLNDVMDVMIKKIGSNLDSRVRGKIRTGAIVISSKYGELCRTYNADDLMKALVNEE
jgi:cobalt-precorrin-5B (C1)-methyltransferase